MEQYTTEQLEAMGFKFMVQRDQAIQSLQAIVNELNKRAQAPLPETITATEEPKEA